MRLMLAGVLVAMLLGAGCLDSPRSAPPGPWAARDGAASSAAAAGPAGAQFFCRTDGGQERELALRKLAVRVTTKPGTVRSHLTMEVAGPAGERVEAVMRLAVPRGAAVTSAILWVNGRPMNGAFVPRDRARQIYRSIVERRRDPALVTWDGPGWVAVRIFPLERGEPRRFEIEWVEPAATEAGFLQYRVPTIVHAGRVVGRPSLEVDGRDLAVGGRAVVPLAPTPASVTPVVAGRVPGDPFHLLMVRTSPAETAARVVMVAETSAAMTAADRVRQRVAIETVLRALPAASKVTLLAADWDVSVVADQLGPADAHDALGKLDGTSSAGALHIERALGTAATHARAAAGSAVLFVGRGIDGFAGDSVREPLRRLRDGGVRLSVMGMTDVPAPLADAAALTGGQTFRAVAVNDDIGVLVDALRSRPAPPSLGARGIDHWHALETVTGQTIWMGRALEVPRPQTNGEPAIAPADAAELAPLWDRARLAWSDRAGRVAPDRSTPAALTPLRALLVLESEQDYARFGLAVPEPAKVEGIFGRDTAVGMDAEAYGVGSLALVGGGSGGGGIGEGTIGLGNLGTIGKSGGGGNGSDYGRGVGGLGGRRAKAPDVIPGQANVRGSLDKEIIRRIIRRHINEIRYCYEQELTKKPALGGRIVVQYTIAPSGQVIAAVLQSSTMGNIRVESCTVQAVRRWEFPKPLGGGSVIVSYPFTFTPAEGKAAAADDPELPDPDRPAREALAVLAAKGDLASRVERIAALLDLDRTSDPESLAWMIDRRDASGPQITLVARLLVAAHRSRDAVRVLSEWAPAAPQAAAAELRHMGADADAAEILALARRER